MRTGVTGRLDRLELLVLAEDSVDYESPCLGQHGLSVLLRARSGAGERSFLFDVGQRPDALLGNCGLLGVDPRSIDGIVLSHCHYDHTGGLAEILRAIGRRGLPVVAHPSIFRPNLVAGSMRSVGMRPEDSRKRLVEAGAELLLSAGPVELMPGLRTTGEIRRRNDFEGPGSALLTAGEGGLEPDAMRDDISLVARVGSMPPIVLTGCAHAGIANILGQVAEAEGGRAFENVLGGFHLVEAPEERIRRTVEALAAFDLRALAAGHCTGFRAQAALYAAFGSRFVPLRTGTRIAYEA